MIGFTLKLFFILFFVFFSAIKIFNMNFNLIFIKKCQGTAFIFNMAFMDCTMRMQENIDIVWAVLSPFLHTAEWTNSRNGSSKIDVDNYDNLQTLYTYMALTHPQALKPTIYSTTYTQRNKIVAILQNICCLLLFYLFLSFFGCFRCFATIVWLFVLLSSFRCFIVFRVRAHTHT